MNQLTIRRTAVAGLLLGVGIAIGSLALEPTVHAESRKIAPREHFKSGGEVSVPILKEIAATLHNIDSRLARVEASLARISLAKPKLASPLQRAGNRAENGAGNP